MRQLLMRRHIILPGMLAIGLVVGIYVGSVSSHPESPTQTQSGRTDRTPPEVASGFAEVAPPNQGEGIVRLEATPTAPPAAALPWSKEELAKWPKDKFHLPYEQKPFLHQMIGETPGYLADGRKCLYRFDLDRFIDSLPTEVMDEARRIKSELSDMISEFDASIRELEKQQWVRRYEAYHEAVEAGNYVVFESGPTDADTVNVIKGVMEPLNLGENNKDFVYITSTARPPQGHPRKDGSFGANIYVRRRDSPRTFELLDEIFRVADQAEDAVRRRLGVPR
jgi:hypothetical protein